MNIINQLDVSVVVVPSGNIVGMTMIIATHLNNHQVGRLFCTDIPILRLVAVCCRGTGTGVRGVVPEPLLMSSQSILAYQREINDRFHTTP